MKLFYGSKQLFIRTYKEENANRYYIGVFDKKGNLIQKSKNAYKDSTEEEDNILVADIVALARALETKYPEYQIERDIDETPFRVNRSAKKEEEANRENEEMLEQNLEDNPEYVENEKKAKLQRRKISGIAIGLAAIIGLSSGAYAIGYRIGKRTSNKTEKNVTELSSVLESPLPSATPLPTVTITPEATMEVTPSPSAETTQTPTYTVEEKIAFINENVDAFLEKYNAITGRKIDYNQALLQLAYINGLNQSQVQFDTNDYILDFLTDYGAYWDAMTTQTKNNIAVNVVDTKTDEILKYEDVEWDKLTDAEKECMLEKFKPIPLKGENPFANGELYGQYILDAEDQNAYNELASQIEDVVTYAYEGKTAEAVASSYKVNRYAAERYVYDNNPDIDFNYQNLSECTKLMNRVMIAHVTHFLPEKTEFEINTLAGKTTMINYDHKKEMASFDENAMGYTLTNNLHYDNDYYYQWLTITETRKTLEEAENCILPTETPKVKTRRR